VSAVPVPARLRASVRPGLVYLVTTLVGVAAFTWPFFLPAEALPAQAHGTDAPLVTALVGLLAVVAVTLELRNGTMNGATVALLGVLAASAGLLRLLNLPGGGSGIFFLVVLAGAAFGPRFGFLLGLAAMVVSAVLTGGIGPWLPFQMLALAWMGGAAGWLGRVTRRVGPRIEVVVLAAYGWVWGFLYGGILNLWFWPFVGGEGGIWYEPGLGLAETVGRYLAFYALTSFAWDAAAALANAALIAVTGVVLLRAMRRFSHRLEPVVVLGEGAAPRASV
jgi:energy-coupling factor transport system substrate-specific component